MPRVRIGLTKKAKALKRACELHIDGMIYHRKAMRALPHYNKKVYLKDKEGNTYEKIEREVRPAFEDIYHNHVLSVTWHREQLFEIDKKFRAELRRTNPEHAEHIDKHFMRDFDVDFDREWAKSRAEYKAKREKNGK
jgi:hypothetical protein